MERTAEALCTCVVDDVHLSNRFGELLQALASSLRNRVTRPPGAEAQSKTVTPGHYVHRRGAPVFGKTMQDATVPSVGQYRNTGNEPGLNSIPIASVDYSGGSRDNGSPSVANEGATYDQINPGAGPDQTLLQDDPLISFAGLGPNQLGWSGGQDFFDMLGPLLDVQYEQYR